jgi:heptosyltransferase-1
LIKVLIIKTSSLGDVVHTLPALTDAHRVFKDIQFDWVVEESFADIPAWHTAVNKVIPVAIRRWRKNIFHTLLSGEWRQFKHVLRQESYDVVIDAQGLLKSAWLTRYVPGKTYGLDKQSAREPLAARFYQYPLSIDRQQHAVERVRELFAKTLGYEVDYNNNKLALDYGIREHLLNGRIEQTLQKQVLFLHGTTWETKHWPDQYWLDLADQVIQSGYQVLLPWGSESELHRAKRIQKVCADNDHVIVLEKMGLNELVKRMLKVTAVVAVDTGLAHLAAALAKPTIALYGPTSPGLTGTYGDRQQHLQVDFECAPCFKKQCAKRKGTIAPECFSTLTPTTVMNSLKPLLK